MLPTFFGYYLLEGNKRKVFSQYSDFRRVNLVFTFSDVIDAIELLVNEIEKTPTLNTEEASI